MHAVVVSVEIQDQEEGRKLLHEQVVPRVKQAPGFVAAYWVQLATDRGTSLLVFEGEDAANGAAEMIRGQPAGGPVRLVDVQVGEVVANA